LTDATGAHWLLCAAMTEMRLPRAALIALSAVLLTAAACSKDKKESTTTTSAAPTTVSSETTTSTVPFTKAGIVLAPDGLGPGLPFYTQSARSINLLMQALGPPDKNTPLPVGTACGATRRLQWGNFQALVNEVLSSSGAGRPGLTGWYLGATSPNKLDFKTEKGITVGSTVAALKAAYGPDVVVAARGEQGPGFTITTPKGIILGLLDAATDAGKIKNLQAGNFCGE
jgi:hypothetical protein